MEWVFQREAEEKEEDGHEVTNGDTRRAAVVAEMRVGGGEGGERGRPRAGENVTRGEEEKAE